MTGGAVGPTDEPSWLSDAPDPPEAAQPPPAPDVPPGDPPEPVWAPSADDRAEIMRRERLAQWPQPVDLSPGAAPDLPRGLLPRWMDDWVHEVSIATQPPPDLAGLLSLAVVALAVSRRYEVRPRPGWTEVLCLYVAAVLSPASRKSAVFAKAIRPVTDYERRRGQDMAGEVARSESEYRILEAALKESENRATRAKRATEREDARVEALSLAEELANFKFVNAPRLIVEDITPEAMTKIMAEQNGRLGLFSSEGGFFDTLAGRYSNGIANLDMFLKAHTGDPCRVDRVGRNFVRVDRPVLTLGLTIQPGVLRDLATKPGFLDRGVIGRILYALPIDNIGWRDATPEPISHMTEQAYHDHVSRLLKLGDMPGSIILDLSEDAMLLHVEHEERIERRMRPGAPYSGIRSWAGKLNGTSARFAGLLHLASGDTSQQISATTMDSAIKLADHYAAHALRAFGAMTGGRDRELAREVVAWLRSRPYRVEISRREIYRGMRKTFARAADLDKVLEYLEETDWLRILRKSTRSGRGRPSIVCEVSPWIWEE